MWRGRASCGDRRSCGCGSGRGYARGPRRAVAAGWTGLGAAGAAPRRWLEAARLALAATFATARRSAQLDLRGLYGKMGRDRDRALARRSFIYCVAAAVVLAAELLDDGNDPVVGYIALPREEGVFNVALGWRDVSLK